MRGLLIITAAVVWSWFAWELVTFIADVDRQYMEDARV